jgi:mannose/fructose/N-acetylgalactosamine-specific phosphotransferase system component IIB
MASPNGDVVLGVVDPPGASTECGEGFVIPTLWVRVDDRLLHGQVTVGWRQHLQPDEIWIVDNLVRADPFLSDVLCMAAPTDVTVRVYSVAEAISAWSARSPGPCACRADAHEGLDYSLARSLAPRARLGILLLVKIPQVALALAESGLVFRHLNIGNIAPMPGSRRVFRTISLAPQHIAALDALTQRGVSITFQLTPDDSRVDWQTVRRQHLG